MQFGLFEDRPQGFTTLDELVAVMMKLEDDPLFPPAPTWSSIAATRGPG
jgi:hypothetical protein